MEQRHGNEHDVRSHKKPPVRGFPAGGVYQNDIVIRYVCGPA